MAGISSRSLYYSTETVKIKNMYVVTASYSYFTIRSLNRVYGCYGIHLSSDSSVLSRAEPTPAEEAAICFVFTP